MSNLLLTEHNPEPNYFMFVINVADDFICNVLQPYHNLQPLPRVNVNLINILILETFSSIDLILFDLDGMTEYDFCDYFYYQLEDSINNNYIDMLDQLNGEMYIESGMIENKQHDNGVFLLSDDEEDILLNIFSPIVEKMKKIIAPELYDAIYKNNVINKNLRYYITINCSIYCEFIYNKDKYPREYLVKVSYGNDLN